MGKRAGRTGTDWVDSVVVGGATYEDVVNGRVTDSDIDPEVVSAFHAQYPNQGSFVEKVQEMDGDPERLQGLVSGVKGKLFEQEYVDYLNDGHLPAGYTAEMAASPTQPGWDVAIRGPGGEVLDQLQLKATDDVGYVKEAIAAHPEYDVVVPADVVDRAGQGVIDSGIELDEVTGSVVGAAEIAGDEVLPDLFPELAFVFIGATTAYALVRGRGQGRGMEIARQGGRRMVQAAVAGGAGGLAAWAFGPWVGVPVAIGTRLMMGGREVSVGTGDRAAKVERMAEFAESVFAAPQRVRLLTN